MKSPLSLLPKFLLLICLFTTPLFSQTRNGMVTTKDEHGVVREKGEMNKGRREGEWKFYNANGKLEQISNYEGGKLNGAEIHFQDGDTISIQHFKNDQSFGEYKKWNSNHQLILRWHFDANGNPIGENFTWENSGRLTEYTYVDEQGYSTTYEYVFPEHISRIYHKRNFEYVDTMVVYNVRNTSTRDSIQETIVFVNGKKNGENLVYRNGYLLARAHYCADEMCDTAFTYEESGKIYTSTPYLNGKSSGVERRFHNGKLIATTNLKEGMREGKQTYFDTTGKTLEENWFAKDRLDSGYSYSAKGKPFIYKHTVKKLNDVYSHLYVATTYYENGKMQSNYTYDSYYGYYNVMLEGPMTTYFPNGKTQSLITYKSNLVEGKYKKWNEKGGLMLEAQCKNNTLEDSILVWDVNGNSINAGSSDFDAVVVKYMDINMSYKGGKDDYYKSDSSDTFEDCKVYGFAQTMPNFPNGAFQQYLQKNLKYPSTEKEMGMQGTVYISFIITRKGKVADVKCLKEVKGAPGLTKEAIRVMRSMPDWTPADTGGTKVNVRMVQPIRFTLQ